MKLKNTVDTTLSKLIFLGKQSILKGSPEHQIQTYEIIEKGLFMLEESQAVRKDQVFSCIDLFRCLIELHRAIVSNSAISKNKIPNIYEATNSLSSLLVKSAKAALESNDKQVITEQCETLLTVSNDIRLDRDLRQYGILDKTFKDAIGRLRQSAHIKSIFDNEEYEAFLRLTEKTGDILNGEDLELIGATYQKLIKASDKIKNRYVRRLSFIHYLRKYKHAYLEKIKDQVHQISDRVKSASLVERRALMEKLSLLESMDQYHEDAGVSLVIQRAKRTIANGYITPLENSLSKLTGYFTAIEIDQDYKDYRQTFLDRHGEMELFESGYYDETLQQISPDIAIERIEIKLEKLKHVDLRSLRHIKFEEAIENLLTALLQNFKAGIA